MLLRVECHFAERGREAALLSKAAGRSELGGRGAIDVDVGDPGADDCWHLRLALPRERFDNGHGAVLEHPMRKPGVA